MLDLLNSFQDTLKVMLGAFIAIFGTIIAKYLQDRTEARHQREKLLLSAIELTLLTGQHARSVCYAKVQGLEKILELEQNPAVQLYAIVLVHFPTAFRNTQALIHCVEDIHGLSVNSPDYGVQSMDKIKRAAGLAQEIVRELNAISEREAIGVNLKQVSPKKSK